MIKLYNVIDIRTEQFHSVVICSEKKAKFFVPANIEEAEE